MNTVPSRGTTIGAFGSFETIWPVRVRFEMLHVEKGFRINNPGPYFEDVPPLTVSSTVKYLEINMVGLYPRESKLFIFTGPSIGIFLNGENITTVTFSGLNHKGVLVLKAKDVTIPDIGIIFGIAYQMRGAVIGLRINQGIDRTYIEEIRAKNRSFQINLTYRLRITR